jgi:hypothetical protein
VRRALGAHAAAARARDHAHAAQRAEAYLRARNLWIP